MIGWREAWRFRRRDTPTLSLLRAQVEMMEERAAAFGGRLVDDPFLFSHEPEGDVPWLPGSISQYFGRLRERLGLDHLRFKQLRSLMDLDGQEAGFSLVQVALRAGHDPAVESRLDTGRVTRTDRQLAQYLTAGADDRDGILQDK